MNVHIEFCIKWNYDPEFERVSNIIHASDTNANITSNETSPRTGSFEVTIDEELVFSKLQKNEFPSEEEINSWLS